jgi:heavy metal translocating P-type ATPase
VSCAKGEDLSLVIRHHVASTSPAPSPWTSAYRHYALVAIATLGLAAGALLWWLGRPDWSSLVFTLATLPVLLALLVEITQSLRRGDVGLDVVAALSMSAALVFGETLAGNVVALMYAGGQLLETFAQGRARREMTALLGRVAHTAMRYRGQELEEVPISTIVPGDRLLIRKGETLPVDGHVAGSAAVLDLSALTGESMPQQVAPGGEGLSGATSVGSPFELVASRPAAQSTYAAIVRLVEGAQASKAPMVRLADRYAIWFLAFTVAVATAGWALTGDPIRALSVLVVATPCPLILAVPVAIISGISRVARIGVLVKGGGILETLARIEIAVLDKTGTLTHGQAAVSAIRATSGFAEDEVLRLAASLDQASGHVVAAALVAEATRRGLLLSVPNAVDETAGEGLTGRVDGRQISVGADAYVAGKLTVAPPAMLREGLPKDVMTVAVSSDGVLAGLIVLEDGLRDDAGQLLEALRSAGVRRIVLASGDRDEIAQSVGRRLGVDAAVGALDPQGKVAIIRREAATGPVMMVGDGVNDAPALAAADVGVAMGARGTAASSEAAGVVLLVDQLGPLAKAIVIAKRTRGIALQSVFAGLGLSVIAMMAAAFGYLSPVQGALIQEAIDVAVILNALRALR